MKYLAGTGVHSTALQMDALTSPEDEAACLFWPKFDWKVEHLEEGKSLVPQSSEQLEVVEEQGLTLHSELAEQCLSLSLPDSSWASFVQLVMVSSLCQSTEPWWEVWWEHLAIPKASMGWNKYNLKEVPPQHLV